MKFGILHRGVVVTQYGHKCKRIAKRIITVDRYDKSAKRFEELLAKRAGADVDNHTMYSVDDGKDIYYVYCSDSDMMIGLGMVDEC